MGGSRERVWFFVEFSSRLTGGWRVLRLAVREFCSKGYFVHFCMKTQSAPGCGMGGSRERVWFFVEFSSRLTGGWRVLRLAVNEFCSSAGILFTFV